VLVLLLFFSLPGALLQAQEEAAANPVMMFTDFPSQVIDIGETVTLNLTLRSESALQFLNLDVQGLPQGWTATFRGNNRTVHAAYADPEEDTSLQLLITPPADVAPGAYSFTVTAKGEDAQTELPISLIVEERAPANLTLGVELPVIRGKPDTTFRYNVTLKNEGSEPATVDLQAEAPQFMNVVFKSAGQEVASIPVDPNGTERLSVEVTSLVRGLPAGEYPVTIHARSGDLEASIPLVAEVVGQPSLVLTTPDGRLSGQAEIGVETPITLILVNDGSAPLRNLKMSSTKPSGWSVEFAPEEIAEIQPGQQVEVTARVKPADKALAGDYEITFRATPQDSTSDSVEYRVTVTTSTLWGIVGVALIAVAVAVVGVSVMRFGRR
jgi:uncharacterized membrane protein